MTAPTAAATGTADAETVPTWSSAWCAALDALELEVGRVEALLSDDHARRDSAWAALATAPVEWTAPTDLPPLPADLAERAMDVLHRQATVAAALGLAMTANRRQSLLARRMSVEATSRPAYIDSAV
jgi:hypothetical protein